MIWQTLKREKRRERKVKKLQSVILIAFMMILSAFPMIIRPAKASVYNYSITDIKQTAPDTIVVSAQCLFCSGCNPNDPGWPDRGTGCTPFGCGYPPASFPSDVPCQHGSPNGRYAAIRLKDSSGSVIQLQKLVCDQSNWPLETLWSHNFVFSGLSLRAGENITIEADFYCSYCYHWYATPKTFVPNKYSIVFVPLNWQGDLSSFYTEANNQANFLVDNVGVLTPDNTEVINVNKNFVLSFDKANYAKFNKWADISKFANDNNVTGHRYVAITNENIWGSVVGLSNWGPVVVVEAGYKEVTAHELGHSWSLLDEYNGDYWQQEKNDKYPTSTPPNSYPGDDAELASQPIVKSYGRQFDTKRCILGPAGNYLNGTPIVRGYCPAHTQDSINYVGCSAHVDATISNEWSGPSSGLVKTVITFYKNGTSPKVEEISGLPIVGKPMQCLRPSNYSIQVYSEEGDLIYDSNITASFWLLPSQPIWADQQPIETDETTVYWLAPAFSESEVTVELKDNVQNEVITSQIVAISPIAEAWIDYKTTDKAIYDFGETIEVTTEINTTLPSMDVVLDVSLLDPNNIVQDYRSWVGTIYPTADPIKLYMSVPNLSTTGTWTVYVTVLNSTGQLQDSKKHLITVGANPMPPTTTLIIGSPKFADMGGNIYISSCTPFSLVTIDNLGGSGVAFTAYKMRNVTYDGEWLTYSGPFYLAGLADGQYSISYNSTDNVGNMEQTQNATVILDNNPPTTALTVGEPQYASDKLYVDTTTPLTLSTSDTSSGVRLVTYRIRSTIYDSGWLTYQDPFNLTSLNDGNYTVSYFSMDNLNNTETIESKAITIDNTAPTTTCSPIEGNYSRTIAVTLSATDGQIGSGVNETFYKIDQENWTRYTGGFNLTSPGQYNMSFYSVDKLGNAEQPRSLKYMISVPWNPGILLAAVLAIVLLITVPALALSKKRKPRPSAKTTLYGSKGLAIKACPTCGHALSYAEQYKRWYCSRCRKFAD